MAPPVVVSSSKPLHPPLIAVGFGWVYSDLIQLNMASFQKNASTGNFEYVPQNKREPGLEGVAITGLGGPDLNLDGDGLCLDGVAEASL